MSLRKDNGISRRPLEYALIALAIALIAVLLFSLKALRDADVTTVNKTNKPTQTLTGTKDEIDRLAEDDAATEEALDKSYDDQEQAAATADAAADNIGGVFDETDY